MYGRVVLLKHAYLKVLKVPITDENLIMYYLLLFNLFNFASKPTRKKFRLYNMLDDASSIYSPSIRNYLTWSD